MASVGLDSDRNGGGDQVVRAGVVPNIDLLRVSGAPGASKRGDHVRLDSGAESKECKRLDEMHGGYCGEMIWREEAVGGVKCKM